MCWACANDWLVSRDVPAEVLHLHHQRIPSVTALIACATDACGTPQTMFSGFESGCKPAPQLRPWYLDQRLVVLDWNELKLTVRLSEELRCMRVYNNSLTGVRSILAPRCLSSSA
jgi:hypothetical protein